MCVQQLAQAILVSFGGCNRQALDWCVYILCSYLENHALVVEIDPECLLAKAGVEVGDVLDELCGEHVVNSSHGKVGQHKPELSYYCSKTSHLEPPPFEQ